MGSRMFAVAGVGALGLVAYAMWTTLRPAPASSSRATSSAAGLPVDADARTRPGPSRRAAPRPNPARAPATRSEPRNDRQDEVSGDTDADTPVPAKVPFDYPLERFDMAVKMLRQGEANGPDRAALLQQAELAIKDMKALLDPQVPTHKRDLTRATAALAQLQAH